jgi:hypothetical protein
VKNLGIGDYQPTDPKTANYIEAAKAVQPVPLSAAVSQSIAASLSVVDLKQSTHSQAVLAKTQTLASVAVATSIQNGSEAIATSVALISSATGDMAVAIAAATSVSDFLNTATETSITDTTSITNLINT